MKADIICAWCGKKIGDTQTPDGSPSHGICRPCLKALDPDIYQAIMADRTPQTARQPISHSEHPNPDKRSPSHPGTPHHRHEDLQP